MTLGSMSLNPGVRCGYLRLPGSIMRRKSSLLYESFPEEGESWNHIELKTRIKSLDHLDRLILAVKNLVKEL